MHFKAVMIMIPSRLHSEVSLFEMSIKIGDLLGSLVWWEQKVNNIVYHLGCDVTLFARLGGL
jgi:hypothetical protein